MKTCKKLLAVTIALVLLVSTFVSGLVVSAADANTLVIGTTEIAKGTATADVEFTLTYAEATKAPHSLCTITAADGLTLTALTLGAVDYVTVGDTTVDDDELVADAAKITIDDDGKNIAAGKVLFESAVDSNAPTVKSIKFTATFTVANPDTIADYDVNAVIDATNYGEAELAIDVTAGKVSVVEPPHECVAGTPVPNGDGTHNVPCIDPECDKLFAENVACTYADGFCSACGFPEPVTEPECEHANVEFVSATPAVGSDNSQNIETSKGSITLKCTDCGETLAPVDVNYSYYSRTASMNLIAESETLIRFNARYERDFSRVVSNANITKMFIVLENKSGDKLLDTKVFTKNTAEYTVDADNYKVYAASYGICGKAMCDTVTSTVYVYDDTTKAWYSGISYTTSVKNEVESILVKSSTGDLQKSMLVNLLNYGAAAQLKFNYNTSSLANADIDAYQSYATTADSFADTTFPIITENTPEYFVYAFGGDAEAKVLLRPAIRLPRDYLSAHSEEEVKSAFPADSIKVVVNYKDFKGVAQTETFTYGEDTLGGEGLLDEGRISRYLFYLPISSPDFRCAATFQVYVNDVACGPASTYSLSNFLGYLVASGDANTKDMANKLMAFSDSAVAFLNSK